MHAKGLTAVSVYSNLAGGAAEGAALYISAVLDLLGDRDPLEVLRSSVQGCVERTAGLTQEQLHAAETSGQWSIVGVLQHLADSELVWGYRLRRILAEDQPVLTGFDQDLWANRLGYATADRDEALGLFAALREANLRLLGRASKEDLDRVGVHAERGEESLSYMIRLYAGHDLVHRKQLERIVETVA